MAAKRIAGRLNMLSVREVQTAGEGDHNDGGGLLLRVRGNSCTWEFRYTASSGKRREMGLGIAYRNNPTIAGQSITNARDRAQDARAQLQKGVDPIDTRASQHQVTKAAAHAAKVAAQRDHLTLARAARAYHERVIEPSRTPKHAAQWIASLERNIPAALWHKPIASIEALELLDAIAELHARIPETASRVRQRLEVVFDDCVFRKQCAGNPAAAIRKKLREVRRSRDRGQFAALPFDRAPALMCGHTGYCALKSRRLFQCNACARQTSVTAGTVFAGSKLPLAVWFLATHLITQAKNGMSSLALARELGISHNSAWLMKHKLMQAMLERETARQLTGSVQIDDA